MKKLVSAAMAVLMVLSLCACQSETKNETPSANTSISTSTSVSISVEVQNEVIEKTEDENTGIVNTETEPAEVETSEKTEVNVPTPPQPEEKLYLLAKISTEDEYEERIIYQYDSFGNLIEEHACNSYDPGRIYSQVKYIYNDKNQKIEEKSIKPESDEEIYNRKEYEYSDDGLHIIEKNFDWNNEFDYSYETVYDLDGKIIEKSRYRSSGILDKKSVYTYDDKGHLISEAIYNKNDEKTREYTTEYEFDEFGFVVKQIEYSDGDLSKSYEYENDEYGNHTKILNYDKTGYLSSREEYKYDEYGNAIYLKTFYSEKIYLYGTLSQTAEDAIEIYMSNVETVDVSTLAGDWFNYFDWMGTPPDDFEYLKISVSAEGTFVFDNMSSGHIVEGNVTEATVVDGKTVFSTDTDITITYDSASTITIAYGDTVGRLYSPAAMY